MAGNKDTFKLVLGTPVPWSDDAEFPKILSPLPSDLLVGLLSGDNGKTAIADAVNSSVAEGAGISITQPAGPGTPLVFESNLIVPGNASYFGYYFSSPAVINSFSNSTPVPLPGSPVNLLPSVDFTISNTGLVTYTGAAQKIFIVKFLTSSSSIGSPSPAANNFGFFIGKNGVPSPTVNPQLTNLINTGYLQGSSVGIFSLTQGDTIQPYVSNPGAPSAAFGLNAVAATFLAFSLNGSGYYPDGNYTPVITPNGGIEPTPVPTVLASRFSRTGNVVEVTQKISLTANDSGISFYTTLPVAATFTNSNNASLKGQSLVSSNSPNPMDGNTYGAFSDVGTGRVRIESTVSIGSGAKTLNYSFSYTINN